MSEASTERAKVAETILRVFGPTHARNTLASWWRIADSCDARSVEAALRGEGTLERTLRRHALEWRADAQELARQLES